uniref:Receptor ligand binding region domain-containing protein n=1 Tax=Plectus sambesii TaxID=2011161 RepID=A0A914VVC9_9BILA
MKSFLSAVSLLSLVPLNQAATINVGHVYWFKLEATVMDMAYNDLLKKGILPLNYKFKLHSRIGCALYNRNLSVIHGVKEATDLYLTEDIDVFFGSPCSEETKVIGQLAAAANWNLPVLGYLSSDDTLSDKTVYNTLARTSTMSTTFFAQAVKAIVVKNGWKKVAYVGSDVYVNNLNRKAVLDALNSAGVGVHVMITAAYPTWQSIANSKAMIDLHANARIILVMFGLDMSESESFMAAAHYLGYTADPSFVFILFSVGSTSESQPWDADYDGMGYPYLRAAYEGAYILQVAGLDYDSINTFRQKLFASQNITNPSVRAYRFRRH